MRRSGVVIGVLVGLVAAFVTVALVVPQASRASASPTTFTTFHGLTPARLLDTRAGYTTIDGKFQGTGAVTLSPGAMYLPVAGRGGVPTIGVAAVAVNVTSTDSSANGFLVLTPNGSGDLIHPVAGASNLNWAAGQTVANMAIVPLNQAGSIAIAVNTRTDVIVDVLGWFPVAPTATALTPRACSTPGRTRRPSTAASPVSARSAVGRCSTCRSPGEAACRPPGSRRWP